MKSITLYRLGSFGLGLFITPAGRLAYLDGVNPWQINWDHLDRGFLFNAGPVL